MATDDQPTDDCGSQPSFVVADEDHEVVVRKLFSKGERLEIARDDASIKLDALLLESLSWQRERGVLDELVDGETEIASDPVPAVGGSDVDGLEPISISNEYSHTTVSKVSTEEGAALRIETPGRGTAINLGDTTLAALAEVDDTFVFSAWFRTPFGPEDAPLEGPL